MRVVIVESPAKAKTINKYLGSGYTVLASYGHVRDLPAKDGSVNPEAGFQMEWALDERGEQRIKEIAKAVKGADSLYLATDPDREGEAISWHVTEALSQRKVLGNIPIYRVVFNQITKNAVLQAMANPRQLDHSLIDAYLARRALDYLVGFTLSPVLWRKLPGSRSAGRVQSVALRLITERESEIEAFIPEEYWTIIADCHTQEKSFQARLTVLDGIKLEKFSLNNQATTLAAVARAQNQAYAVASVETKRVQRHPPAPFTTSTLQQEASRKLNFGASRTMQLAQRLYEGIDIDGETVGLITYMRTDSVQVAEDAITGARSYIHSAYGASYVPEAARHYKTKAKNAQEAHEAIRPTDLSRTPDQLAKLLDADQLKLYTLVWRRMVASQMASAQLDQVSADIASPDDQIVFRATGSTLVFDGFLKLYEEGRDDESDEQSSTLPRLIANQPIDFAEITPFQHFTTPPPRYTEASLVKKMEELGIGRPSTYASILQVLQERQYVRLDGKAFFPEDRGRIVTSFLTNFFDTYFQYGFTAALESQLDEVADGKASWRDVLAQFWSPFKSAIDSTKSLTIQEVLATLERELAVLLFPPLENGEDPRACSSCKTGRLNLKLGKFGAFIGCSNYPDCNYTRPISVDDKESQAAALPKVDPVVLGNDPQTGQEITRRTGPYGPYIQLGEGKGKEKPKRVSIPKGLDPAAIGIDEANRLLSFPLTLGVDPATGLELSIGVGRFGPFLKAGSRFISIKNGQDLLTMDLEAAIAKAQSTPTKAPGEKSSRGRRASTATAKPAKAAQKKSSTKGKAKTAVTKTTRAKKTTAPSKQLDHGTT
jgi:DNA topoisomerase-1